MGIPQADSVASPTTTDVRAAWYSPTETSLHCPGTNLKPTSRTGGCHQQIPPPHLPWLMLKIPSLALWKLHPQTKTQYLWPNPMLRPRRTCQPLGPLVLPKLGNQVAPYAGSVDESAGLPTLSGCPVKEKQCVSALTATLEILNLEAPSVVVGHQGATVEELAEEDLAEGCP